MKTEDRITEAFAPFHSSLTLGEIERDRAPEEPSPTPRRRRARWTWSLGVAAVLAVAALLLQVTVPFEGPGATDPAVASLFQRFARIARNAPAEAPPGDGEYVYTEQLATQSFVFVSGDEQTRFVYEEPATYRRWLGTDGSGRIVSEYGRISFPSAADRAAYESWVASGGPDVDGLSFAPVREVDVFDPGELSFLDTSQLPTDPDALQAVIEDREIIAGPEGDRETFVLAADLLRSSWARPELRAALYEVMARLPGISVIGRTQDALGREGVALASTHNGMRYEIVFAPRSGEILEEREVVIEETEDAQRVLSNPGPTSAAYAAPGGLLYRMTYVSFGDVVASTTAVPEEREGTAS